MTLCFDPSTTVLAGLTQQQLQANLTAAQKAYAEVMTGTKVVTASYSTGEGSQTVSYDRTNLAQLTLWIRMLQAALGIGGAPRRPVRFNFR